MVVVAEFAERIIAAPQPTIRTDCYSAVRTLDNGNLAVQHSNIPLATNSIWQLRILYLRRCQLAAMPARSRFLMPFSLKQFFPTLHLRILTVLDLEPRRPLQLRDVGFKTVLRHDVL
jgi:hypothetical protein